MQSSILLVSLFFGVSNCLMLQRDKETSASVVSRARAILSQDCGERCIRVSGRALRYMLCVYLESA